jgi:hypothetical protein
LESTVKNAMIVSIERLTAERDELQAAIDHWYKDQRVKLMHARGSRAEIALYHLTTFYRTSQNESSAKEG